MEKCYRSRKQWESFQGTTDGMRKLYNRASPVGKPYNRPGGRGNAPLLVAGATTFPPGGGTLFFAMR